MTEEQKEKRRLKQRIISKLHYEKNRLKIAEKRKERWEINPEHFNAISRKSYLKNREKNLAKAFTKYRKNRAAAAARSRKSYLNNKDKRRIQSMSWRKNNPLRAKEIKDACQAKLRAARLQLSFLQLITKLP